MSAPIPMPLRAAAGLAAVAIDEARRLPTRLVGLPVSAVGAALQVSLKAQQRYAELVARGDQLLGHLRGQRAGTPPWARFDEEEMAAAGGAGSPGAGGRAPSAFDAAGDPDEPPADVLADVLAEDAEDADDVVDGAGPLDASPATLPAMSPGGGDADVITLAEADGAVGPVIESVPTGTAEEEIGVLADDASRYDGFLGEPPLPDYERLSIPQLRARLRTLTERQLEDLVAYERATAGRPPYLTMLENRLSTVRGG
jgi:hypothetical protein